MKKIKYFNFTTNGTNRHEQQGNMITRVRGLFSLLCAAAVLFTACEFNFDSRPGSSGGEFVAVESIDGIPAVSVPYIAISLSGTVMPENATNKKAEWSVKADGGTNSVVEGARLTANGEGTVTVTARIANGLAEGADYTQDFSIVISLSAPYKVTDIHGIPSTLSIGSHTLEGRVSPSNAAHQNIVWSVTDQGTTGAVISGDVLTITAFGTVTIRGTVENGKLEDGDFTKDFSIFIPRNDILVVGFGWANSSRRYPIYWEGGELKTLGSYTGASNSRYILTGVVYSNGRQFICGYQGMNNDQTPYYWVDGVEKTLTRDTSIESGRVGPVSITVDSVTSDVYILGVYLPSYTSDRPNRYCYWKVNENGIVGSRVDLSSPRGNNVGLNSTVYSIAVHNGKVFIPFSDNVNGNIKNYYWNENGIAHEITLAGVDEFIVYCAGVVGGRVYIGGQTSYSGKGDTLDNGGIKLPLCFEVVNENTFARINVDISGVSYKGYVEAIGDQHGSLWLYGSDDDGLKKTQWMWNAAGSALMPYDFYKYDFTKTVSLDGNVYIPMNATGNYPAYTVFDQFDGHTTLLSWYNKAEDTQYEQLTVYGFALIP